jgi:hypothetical protein
MFALTHAVLWISIVASFIVLIGYAIWNFIIVVLDFQRIAKRSEDTAQDFQK